MDNHVEGVPLVNIPKTRTRWAEQQTERFLARPFISEFVFRSPQKLDGFRGIQKEVADLLVVHKGTGLLVSQKAQEDPDTRDDRRNEFWVLKNTRGALSQLIGALRSPGTPFWCDHPRRGRVDFPTGLPPIAHGVVIVETFRPVDLQAVAADLPLKYGDTPIAYLSINDFLNLTTNLRSIPELFAYLDARRELPDVALRRVGNEQVLLEYYLLHQRFTSCSGHEQAVQTLKERSDELEALLERLAEHHYYSSRLEHVADALAIRSSTCVEGISPELMAKFDPPETRQNYLRMQAILTDLSLRERAELGRQFHAVVLNIEDCSQGYAQASAHLDSKPDWVFVFGSSKGWDRSKLLSLVEPTMRAALAFYKKPHCMIVIDRDGAGYEVAVTRADAVFVASPADVWNGEKIFGRLRSTSRIAEGF